MVNAVVTDTPEKGPPHSAHTTGTQNQHRGVHLLRPFDNRLARLAALLLNMAGHLEITWYDKTDGMIYCIYVNTFVVTNNNTFVSQIRCLFQINHVERYM